MWHVRLGGVRRCGTCGWEGCSNVACAAGRGVAMWCMQLRGGWRRGTCSYEGCGELGHQLWKSKNITKSVGKGRNYSPDVENSKCQKETW